MAMTRKGYLLATAGGVAAAGAAGAAQAADLAVKASPPPAPALWAGWYIGLNAGAAWQHGKGDAFTSDPFEIPVYATTHTTGFIGGGQLGYNWQSGSFVYGLEGDIDGLTGTGRTLAGALLGPGGTPKGNFSNSIRWLSTIRGRLGVTVGDTGDTLLYATGGLAVGGVNDAFMDGRPVSAGAAKSESKTLVGWTVGGGIEHILWNSHWTVGLEGLFVNLGNSSTTIKALSGFGATLTSKTSHFSNTAAIARFKLNYKF
jgi:outer membrane immunogenic protein